MKASLQTCWAGAVTGLLLFAASSALAFEDAEVRAIIRHVPEPERVGDAPAVWMAREKTLRIDGGGGATEKEHLFARILDPDRARESFSPYSVDYWSENCSVRVLAARIWKEDLTFVALPPEAVRDDLSPLGEGHGVFEMLRRVTIDFPSVEPGDVLEIRLAKARVPRPGETNVQWFLDTMGDELPVIEQRLEIQTPRALRGVAAFSGPAPYLDSRIVDSFDGRGYLSGHLLGLPGPVEGGVFSRRATVRSDADSVTTIAYSNVGWDYLSKYLGRQWYLLVQEISPEMTTAAGKLFSQKTDPRWRAEALGKWARDDFETVPVPDILRFARPFDPATVFANGEGGSMDKALFLTAALRLAGVGASPVFVRSQTGSWVEEVASLDQFDRVVVKADVDPPLWLDPSGKDPLPPGKGLVVTIVDPRLTTFEQDDDFQYEFGLIDFPGTGPTER